MAAITWRNVDAPSLDGVGRTMQGAQSAIDNSFNTLGRVLKQRETAGIAQWEEGKVANTNAVLDRVSKAATPEELQALAASGEIDQMVAGYGDQVDKAGLRDVVNTQLNTLRQRSTATNAYNAGERDLREAPIAEAYRVAVLNKDEKAQAEIRAANPGLKNWSTLLADEQKTEQGFADRVRTDRQNATVDEAAAYAASQLPQTRADAEAAAAKVRQVAALEKAHAASVQKHRERQSVYGQTLTRMGKAQGFELPTDGQGRVRLDELSAAQYEKLKTMAGNQEGNILQAYEQGDSKMADTFLSEAAASGKYSPEILEQTRTTLRSAYNTDNNEVLVGRDAANVERASAQQKVLDDETRRVNPHVPGSGGAMEMFKRIDESLPLMLDRTSGVGVDEDLPDMRNEIYKMVTEGVQIGDTKITPSEEIIKLAAGKAQGSWLTDSSRAKNLRQEVIKMMNEKGMLKLYKEGQGVQMRDRTRLVEKELKALRTK